MSPTQLTINNNGVNCNGESTPNEFSYNYERVEAIAKFISSKTTIKPKLGIICGSGLNGITDQLINSQIVKYKEIPDFPQSTGKNEFFFSLKSIFQFLTFSLI